MQRVFNSLVIPQEIHTEFGFEDKQLMKTPQDFVQWPD
jgi:hypothetical protein